MAIEHPPLIDRDRAHLLVIDVQTKLLPAMAEPDLVIHNISRLLKAAAILGVPHLVSEQYPKGLGATVEALRDGIDAANVIEKIDFSAYRAPVFRDRIIAGGRGQLLVTGIESHVCVLQTALEARAAGHQVFLIEDAVSSRSLGDKSAAVGRLRSRGVEIVTTEMVLFEWLGRAGTPAFKQISALIK